AGSVATCESAGVLGSVSAMVGAVQATEAIKCLVGDWAAVERRLVRVDAWGNRHRALETDAARDADCPCCGRGKWELMGVSARGRAVALCGRGAVQVTPTAGGGGAATLERLAEALSAFGPTRVGPGVLRAELVGEAAATGLTVFEDGRTLVHGTEDPAVARSIVARYVGA
ncbi:MAG: thiazole biosynthesis adenylyltransferase ThiF, partial [Planctomycetota bacterium]